MNTTGPKDEEKDELTPEEREELDAHDDAQAFMEAPEEDEYCATPDENEDS